MTASRAESLAHLHPLSGENRNEAGKKLKAEATRRRLPTPYNRTTPGTAA
jgi:hypothetical protein